ncbi:MAG: hypothetical protein B1H11_01890 [Desulfobacteraceae bacterium 4484_190.1]|nr:MAG: hypothetical protein B1H11_01890 [Desulfobacteraceae bacterium 4484_190.1]
MYLNINIERLKTASYGKKRDQVLFKGCGKKTIYLSLILSLGHLQSARLRKILNAVLLCLRFLSIKMIKSDLKLSAISGKLLISKSLSS